MTTTLQLFSNAKEKKLFQLSIGRGEVHNREAGEMARKSREEGEIGAKI